MIDVEVVVELKPDILDPQGKTIAKALTHMGYNKIESVRVGKSIKLKIDTDKRDEAEKMACETAERLLSNPVMEIYSVRIAE